MRAQVLIVPFFCLAAVTAPLPSLETLIKNEADPAASKVPPATPEELPLAQPVEVLQEAKRPIIRRTLPPYQGNRPPFARHLPQAQQDHGSLMTHPQPQQNEGPSVHEVPRSAVDKFTE